MKILLVFLFILIVGACSPVNGVVHRDIEAYPSSAFRPITFSGKVSEPITTAKPTAKPTPKPVKVKPKRQVTLQGAPRPVILSASGLASWYCKAGVSICHHSYGPETMSAAACGKLRAVMGANWRGKTVNVKSGNQSVRVRLIDWCGSKDKLIDLYWKPMHILGGTGVIPVVVSWN